MSVDPRRLRAPKPSRRRRKVSGFNDAPLREIEVQIEDGLSIRTRQQRVVDVVLIMPTGEERPL